MNDEVMKKDERKVQRVCLPKGYFEGDCRVCRYANWNDTKSDGSVYCEGPFSGYVKPEERQGCFIHEKKM